MLFFGIYKKKKHEELNDNYKALKDDGKPSILSTLQGSRGMNHFQKRGNMQKIRKGIFHFQIFSKTVKITYGTKAIFFHHNIENLPKPYKV